MNTKDKRNRVHFKSLLVRLISIIFVSLLIPVGASRVDARSFSLNKTGIMEKKATVKVPAKKVTIQASKKYIQVGDTFTVKAVFEPSNATYKSMTWKVKSGSAIKKVSGNKFKAVSLGTATIEGYQKDTNKRYKATFEVNSVLPDFDVMNLNGEKVSTLTLYPSSFQVIYAKYKNEYDLGKNARVFTYKLKDKKIASVNSLGVLTGKKTGSTTLTVTAPNGVKKEYKLKVENTPSGLWKDSLYLTDMTDKVNVGGYYYSGYYGDSSYAMVDKTYLFALADGKLVLYNYLDEECALSYEVYDGNYKRLQNKKIKLPYPLGGVYLGEDGSTYVVCGQSNIEESDTRTVFSVIKYDKSMKEVGRSNIIGEECKTTIPFDAGSCSMAMQGDTLVIHTARERYTSSDGFNHQSNITIVIDAKTMDKRYVGQLFPYNHVSHSFNQFVRFDGNNVIYVDHGDAYPRSVVMQTHRDGALAMAQKNEGVYWYTDEIDLLNIVGRIGDNHTGTRVGGFEIGKYNNIVAGVSLPHHSMTADELFYYGTKNVYVSLVSKDGNSSKLLWLTDYKEGSNKTAVNLRMLKINEDRFGLIYQIDDFNDIQDSGPSSKIGFILIDSMGEVLARKELEGIFESDMQPVLYQGDIIWIRENTNRGYGYSSKEADYNIVERIHMGELIK